MMDMFNDKVNYHLINLQLQNVAGLSGYPGISPMLSTLPPGGPLGSGLAGAFTPKNMSDGLQPNPLLISLRDREKAAASTITSPPGAPPTKKHGKWCAVHVHIAWEIFHDQQKQQQTGAAPRGVSGPTPGAASSSLTEKSSSLSTSASSSDLGSKSTPSTPGSAGLGAGLRPPAGGPHPLLGAPPPPGMPPGLSPALLAARTNARSPFESPTPGAGFLGGPPFTRPGPFGGLGALPGAAPFGGLGSSLFGSRDGLPGVPSHPEWSRLHRTPPSFPTPPAASTSERERDRERDKSEDSSSRERVRETNGKDSRERDNESDRHRRSSSVDPMRGSRPSSHPPQIRTSRSRSRSPHRSHRTSPGPHHDRRNSIEDRERERDMERLREREREKERLIEREKERIFESQKEREREKEERLRQTYPGGLPLPPHSAADLRSDLLRLSNGVMPPVSSSRMMSPFLTLDRGVSSLGGPGGLWGPSPSIMEKEIQQRMDLRRALEAEQLMRFMPPPHPAMSGAPGLPPAPGIGVPPGIGGPGLLGALAAENERQELLLRDRIMMAELDRVRAASVVGGMPPLRPADQLFGIPPSSALFPPGGPTSIRDRLAAEATRGSPPTNSGTTPNHPPPPLVSSGTSRHLIGANNNTSNSASNSGPTSRANSTCSSPGGLNNHKGHSNNSSPTVSNGTINPSPYNNHHDHNHKDNNGPSLPTINHKSSPTQNHSSHPLKAAVHVSAPGSATPTLTPTLTPAVTANGHDSDTHSR